VAGGQERILRRRIRTVNATKKITRAMELIAASRIVRAQQRVHAAQPYSDQITEVVRDLSAAGGEVSSPLLTARPEIRRACHVVIAADRGLCGAYNSSVVRAAEGEIRNDALRGVDYSLVLVGRKAESYFRFRNYRIDAVFTGFTENPSYEDARAISRQVVDMYEAGEVDSVELVYTRFVSAGFQEVVLRPLVPLEHEVLAGGDARPAADANAGYEFEPSPGEILEALLPRYVEARIYAALLNASASQQAARQRAMKAATDNAEELIKSYTRIMNRARQDTITTEIMEIVGGAEALSSGRRDHNHHRVTVEFHEAQGASAP
jgi:F-type H+-transporting ATPase subunit gamma